MNATLEVALTLACLIALVLTMMAGKIAEYILDAPRRVRKWADDAEKAEQ